MAWPDFSIQNTLTQDMRKTSGEKGKADYRSLWCGQSLRLTKRITAEDLVKRLIQKLNESRFKLIFQSQRAPAS